MFYVYIGALQMPMMMMIIIIIIKFWPSCTPGMESAAGQKILAPPYYSASVQCLRLSAFSLLMGSNL